MIKRLLIMAVTVMASLLTVAQTPMPLNPAVKHGTLPNGLSYYILHNGQPKERANFYIAQKVGSSLENPDQLGLAHFLEHMAFNGTKNFPGKSMLDYLQSKGIRFGQDINAYTSFDETVYNINNVPTTDVALMDSVLLVLHDWSGSILLDEAEIDAERGVIEEEWRMRDDAVSRMWAALLPVLYEEYQYQQLPIGKMEIVRNFAPQVLRDYYHKWYRPDLQGIVIVGDMDVDAMEQKVIATLSDIPKPENPAARVYPEISDNKEPIYAYFADKEFPYKTVNVYFKSDKLPFEMRNTVENYVAKNAVEALVGTMLNERLADFAKTPECKYVRATVSFGDYLMAKTKDAFAVDVVAKEDVNGALAQAMEIVSRACKAGFTDSELGRARGHLLATYESNYNERDTRDNDMLGEELYTHFLYNDPLPGAEADYQVMQQMLPMLPVQAINMAVSELLTPDNQVVMVCEPEREGMIPASRDEILATIADRLNAQYDTFVDEVITGPLITELPAPGQIVDTAEGKFGATEYLLSNGVRVVVKPTDFKSDEILFEAIMDGGKRSFGVSDAPYVLLTEDAYETARLGNFDRKALAKYLAGKNVSLAFSIGKVANMFDGSSTVRDLPTLMELIHASFTALNDDETAYNVQMEQGRTILESLADNPNVIFQRSVAETVSGGNPMYQEPSVELIDAGDYAREMEIIRNLTANAADWTFVFVGNIDLETIKPLLEQYIATLPSAGKPGPVPARLTDMDIAPGHVVNHFKQTMQTPATMVYSTASGRNLPFSVADNQKIELLGAILNDIYLQTLREEEGGTYSPGAFGAMNPYTGRWQIISVFQTNDRQQEQIISRAKRELDTLLKNGASAELFNKAREAARKQLEVKARTNKYWLDNLTALRLGKNLADGQREAIEELTLSEFNTFISTLYDGKDFIEVIMEGVAADGK